MKTFDLRHMMLLTCLGRCITPSLSDQTCEDCPTYRNYLRCDVQTGDLLLENLVWAGKTTENGSIIFAFCGLGNCFINTSGDFIWIPRNMTHRISEFICNQTNRVGILCSQCQPGFGHAINSDIFQCVHCISQHLKVNWIYYILSVYLPLLVVLSVIIRFNIHLTTGPANAFIILSRC